MSQMEFAVGDTVIYAAEGVCRITGIEKRRFCGQDMAYYVLAPVYREGSTVYVPCSNEQLKSRMYHVLTQEAVQSMIEQMPQLADIWIDNENERKQVYRSILANADRQGIMRMIRTLYLHRVQLQKTGRKMHQSDERFLNEAQRMLHDEFAYVLNIRREDVLPLIIGKLEQAE